MSCPEWCQTSHGVFRFWKAVSTMETTCNLPNMSRGATWRCLHHWLHHTGVAPLESFQRQEEVCRFYDRLIAMTNAVCGQMSHDVPTPHHPRLVSCASTLGSLAQLVQTAIRCCEIFRNIYFSTLAGSSGHESIWNLLVHFQTSCLVHCGFSKVVHCPQDQHGSTRTCVDCCASLTSERALIWTRILKWQGFAFGGSILR